MCRTVASSGSPPHDAVAPLEGGRNQAQDDPRTAAVWYDKGVTSILYPIYTEIDCRIPRVYAAAVPRLGAPSFSRGHPPCFCLCDESTTPDPVLDTFWRSITRGSTEGLFLGANLDLSSCQSGHPDSRVAIWINCGSSAPRLFDNSGPDKCARRHGWRTENKPSR